MATYLGIGHVFYRLVWPYKPTRGLLQEGDFSERAGSLIRLKTRKRTV